MAATDYLTRAQKLMGLTEQLVRFSRKAVKRADKAHHCFEAARVLNMILYRFSVDTDLHESLEEINAAIDDLNDITGVAPTFERVVDLVKKLHGRLIALERFYREKHYG